MALNPTIMQAVEQLGYRVTVGDVATRAGLDVNFAQRELLVLASEAGGHLQVAESGEIAYLFPKNFRDVLRNKFFRLQLQEWWQKVWRILFYLIRISFGIILIASILLIVVAITAIIIAINSSSDNDSGGGNGGHSRGGGFSFWPFYWFDSWWWFYSWDYDGGSYYRRRERAGAKPEMNFLEAVFSFIFGDGNPNYNLEERRWRTIAAIIRNHQGAIVAEQIVPYLDQLGQGYALEFEEYMLPVLTRFDGRPEVSPDGQIIYQFPQLQTTAESQNSQPVPSYLREIPWRFSEATSSQLLLAIGLGAVNFVGALILGNLLGNTAGLANLGSFIVFIQAIYPILLGYGIAFLTIPLIRYFWVQWRNSKIESRNQERQQRASLLAKPDSLLQKKLNYAREFAQETVITREDLVYTTETDLLEQEVKQLGKQEDEWQRRLNQSDS